MAQKNNLHIVAFNVPYPPDYGGVIDIFYKIRSLSEEGIKIYLHCFQYGRKKSSELERYCEKVFYYNRNKGLKYALSKKPFIVAGRNHPDLLSNLAGNKAPIFFEGLHTCYFIGHPKLKEYKKIIRTHNVEHDYYSQLAKSETNIFKRIYFNKEAKKLKRFESVVSNANTLITISPSDQEYFNNIHPNSIWVPAFHENEKVISKSGKGTFFLFHG
ncbi:MAG: glycosyltransferase family 1 protein, partial [Mariniphaga sp.]|nr:glycosyltransferase family 1 protein [Mariniphaga sp.]